MRRTIALLAATALVAAVLPAGAAAAAPTTGGATKGGAAKPTAAPAGVNPYLALVPDASKVNVAAWKDYLAKQSLAKATKKAATAKVAASPIVVDEDEPDGTQGSNDTPATAQPVPGFGTKNKQNNRARILGTLNALASTSLPPNSEDDGAIPLARDTGVQNLRPAITTTGTIGDGPHGSAGDGTGDFDFYKIEVTNPGDPLTVDIDTPTGSLDSILGLYDAEGELLAFNDDFDFPDSLLTYSFDTAGSYYILVGGYRAGGDLPADPTDSGSGLGAGSEGPYNLLVRLATADVDVYAVNLRKGDTLGASVTGSATFITVYDPAERNVHGSNQDGTFLYPPQSPLPGGGNAVTDHVAAVDGWHYIAVTGGVGSYDITVEAYRPGLQGQPVQQTIFLDFDGARVNTGIFGGPGVRTLSPFRAFIAKWGLTNADENALIDGIVAEVKENLKQDMIASGLNDSFRLRVLNSRDNADPFGQDNVSRLIVGGTIDESGLSTIGIAQFIDPGNFSQEDTALILLDVLSGSPEEWGEATLNNYLTPASDRVAFVSQAVGNVVSHEAGHFFGNWHTENADDIANLQDQGGENFALLFGVGPDGVGGTADDPDVDFGEDAYDAEEGFTGTENTLARIATVLR